jgi:hypothetical protein
MQEIRILRELWDFSAISAVKSFVFACGTGHDARALMASEPPPPDQYPADLL